MQRSWHSGPLREGYVCRRCNGTDHRIQDCPTNGDPAFDVRKIPNSIGIPRSQLVTVTDPTLPGVMMAPDGSLVVLKSSLCVVCPSAPVAPPPPLTEGEGPRL